MGLQEDLSLVLLTRIFIVVRLRIVGASKSIGFAVVFTRTVDNLELELGQEFGLASLSTIKLLGRHKVFETAVI